MTALTARSMPSCCTATEEDIFDISDASSFRSPHDVSGNGNILPYSDSDEATRRAAQPPVLASDLFLSSQFASYRTWAPVSLSQMWWGTAVDAEGGEGEKEEGEEEDDGAMQTTNGRHSCISWDSATDDDPAPLMTGILSLRQNLRHSSMPAAKAGKVGGGDGGGGAAGGNGEGRGSNHHRNLVNMVVAATEAASAEAEEDDILFAEVLQERILTASPTLTQHVYRSVQQASSRARDHADWREWEVGESGVVEGGNGVKALTVPLNNTLVLPPRSPPAKRFATRQGAGGVERDGQAGRRGGGEGASGAGGGAGRVGRQGGGGGGGDARGRAGAVHMAADADSGAEVELVGLHRRPSEWV